MTPTRTKISINLTKLDVSDTIRYLLRLISMAYPKPLTNMEEIMMIEFLMLPYERFKYSRFSVHARRRVYNTLKMKYKWTLSRANFNGKLAKMHGKGFLIRDEEGQLHVHPEIERVVVKYVKNELPLELTFLFPKANIPSGVNDDGRITLSEKVIDARIKQFEKDKEKYSRPYGKSNTNSIDNPTDNPINNQTTNPINDSTNNPIDTDNDPKE